MPRVQIKAKPLILEGFDRYQLLSTGEIIEKDDNNYKTIQPRRYKDSYIVKLTNKDKEEVSIDYLMLYYKVFGKISKKDELDHKVVLIDGNINNMSLDNLKLCKIKASEYYEFEDKPYSINKILYVIEIIEYYRRTKNLEAIRKKYNLNTKQYMFFVSILPKMITYTKECDEVKYQYIKHLRKQLEIICDIIDNGLKQTATSKQLPMYFLNRVKLKKEWKLSNWLLHSYDKYKNIF